MLALACAAGTLRFAIPARNIVRVLPRQALLPLPTAPDCIVGMLRFQGQLVTTLDLCQLVLNRPALTCPATRIVIVKLAPGTDSDSQPRLLALIAEDVLDLVAVTHSEKGLALPDAAWLGDFARTEQFTLQWLVLEKLMPETLAELSSTMQTLLQSQTDPPISSSAP